MRAGIGLLRAAIASILLFAIPSGAADAHGVLAVPRRRLQTADFETTGRLVRVDPNGTRTSYGITMKGRGFPGLLRVLLQVNSPSTARMHALLEVHFDGASTIRIAHPGDRAPAVLPFDKWSDGPAGPGFSFEDFLEQQYFWSKQSVETQVKFGARDCDLVTSAPGAADRTHYAQVKTWLDHTIGFPVYAEKTVRTTGAVKEFTYMGLRHNGGVWSASQVEEKTRGRGGETLLIIDRGSAKANLSLTDFSPEGLTHF
ncbi:MAG TPA: outer membrane lipoprotein-sorting protein [Terracidiphilus sp.]|nr:outer membrane lipoprotein-sorting protein [Terracidiphilus sp.]